MIYANALNHKADECNSYTRAEIISCIETPYTFNGYVLKIVDPVTGTFRNSLNSNVPINSIVTTRIDIQPSSQVGGSIRIIPALDTGDASIGYYNCMNTRSTSAGDVWICGVNCDNERGYTIATPVLNTCFNIGLNGNINMPYGLTTIGIATSIITASTSAYLILASDVVISVNATIHKNCSIKNNLEVLGNSEFSNIICVKTSGQGGGNLRVEPSVDGQETSIGYYNRSDLRATVAGDVWVGGVSCWPRVDFTIGTPILASCLNINKSGTVLANYILASPVRHTDIIRGYVGDQLTIVDAVITTGNTTINGNFIARGFVYDYSPVAVAQSINAMLSYDQL